MAELIDGNGRTVAPAQAEPLSAEQRALAAEKLARAKAQRAERKAKGETVTTGATPEPQQARPDQSHGDTDLLQAIEPQGSTPAEREHQAFFLAQERERAALLAEAEKLGLHYPANSSVKFLRRKVEDTKIEAEHAARPAEPLTMPDNGPYKAAREAHANARAHVTELEREQAALPGLLQDAINAGDFEALATHRQRQGTLAAELEVARLGMLDAELAMVDAEMPLARAQAQIATARATEVAESIRQANADLFAAQGEADAARARRSELVTKRGNLLRERDAVRAQMLAPQPAHRAPRGF